LAQRITLEGAARWKLSSTLSDLAEGIRQTANTENRIRLQQIYDDLTPLVKAP
jgi:hypothetical protein